MAVLNKTVALLVLPALLSFAQAEQRCLDKHIESTAPASRFQANEDGTVVDKQTGLMWRACVQGVTGKACDQGEALEMNWAEALRHVPEFNQAGGFAGHNDWRLPNIRELGTLLELQCISPAINTTVFPATPSLHAWSSSPAYFHAHYSWHVDFETGAINYGERSKAKAVRLVRRVSSNP